MQAAVIPMLNNIIKSARFIILDPFFVVMFSVQKKPVFPQNTPNAFREKNATGLNPWRFLFELSVQSLRFLEKLVLQHVQTLCNFTAFRELSVRCQFVYDLGEHAGQLLGNLFL